MMLALKARSIESIKHEEQLAEDEANAEAERELETVPLDALVAARVKHDISAGLVQMFGGSAAK